MKAVDVHMTSTQNYFTFALRFIQPDRLRAAAMFLFTLLTKQNNGAALVFKDSHKTSRGLNEVSL